MTLKQLGFSLEDIKLTLSESGHSLRDMMDIQLAQLNDQIEILTERVVESRESISCSYLENTCLVSV